LVMLFVSAIGYAVGKMRTLSCMLGGIMLATCGVMVAGWTTVGYFFLLGIVFFSFGEMLTGPKQLEYFGLIAPPGEKGLYLGYVNIPVAIGQGAGGLFGGWVYGQYGEKAVLALRYLAEHTERGAAGAWDGSVSTLESTLGVARTEAMATLQATLGMNATEATQLLWNTYHPNYVWIPFAAVGVASALAMFVFARMARRWSDMDV